MKMSVLYHTETGNTKRMATVIAEGMESIEGVEAKCFPLDTIDRDWIKESRCVVLGTPTHRSNVSSTIKVWLDESASEYDLAGKIGGAFATSNYVHGGGTMAIQFILDHLMVFGMLVYSGGSALGRPIIHLGPVALENELEKTEDIFRTYGRRMAAKTVEVFKR